MEEVGKQPTKRKRGGSSDEESDESDESGEESESGQSDESGESDQSDQSDQSDKSDQSDESDEQSDESGEQSDESDESDEQSDNQSEQPKQPKQPERPEQPEQPKQPERPEQPEQAEEDFDDQSSHCSSHSDSPPSETSALMVLGNGAREAYNPITVSQLQTENDTLRAELHRLQAEVDRLQKARAPTVSVQSMRFAPTTEEVKPTNSYKMVAVLPAGLDDGTADRCFKDTMFGFPHKVQPSKCGAADLLVENRITVRLVFELRDVHTNNKLLGSSLPARPKFRLDVVHAKDESLVRNTDFKTLPKQLIGGGKLIETLEMGRVVFSFKIGFLSTQSKHDGQFCFKLSCITPELSMFPLEACTPAWRSVSRNTQKKP